MKHLIAMLMILSAACDRSGAFHPRQIDSALTQAMRGGPGRVVSLDSLGPREWRSMYVFGPYTPEDVMRKCLATTAAFESYGVYSRDDLHVIMFQSATGRLSSMTASRRNVDFASEAVSHEYPRGNASFVVRRTTTGGRNELVPTGSQTRACSP